MLVYLMIYKYSFLSPHKCFKNSHLSLPSYSSQYSRLIGVGQDESDRCIFFGRSQDRREVRRHFTQIELFSEKITYYSGIIIPGNDRCHRSFSRTWLGTHSEPMGTLENPGERRRIIIRNNRYE